MVSVFRNVIEFMAQVGVYDVILPFLLIFTILFAILEKSKVFGLDVNGQTRKSLNSLTAFVVGFLVIASSQVVAIINQAVAQIMILLILAVFFMVLVGSFLGHKEGKPEELNLPNGLKWTAIGILGFSMVLIFLNAIKLRSGVSILEFIYNYVISNTSGTVVGTIVFLGLIVGGMAWIIRDPSSKKGGS